MGRPRGKGGSRDDVQGGEEGEARREGVGRVREAEEWGEAADAATQTSRDLIKYSQTYTIQTYMFLYLCWVIYFKLFALSHIFDTQIQSYLIFLSQSLLCLFQVMMSIWSLYLQQKTKGEFEPHRLLWVSYLMCPMWSHVMWFLWHFTWKYTEIIAYLQCCAMTSSWSVSSFCPTHKNKDIRYQLSQKKTLLQWLCCIV